MLTFLRTLVLAGLVWLATAGRNLAWLRAAKDEAREFDYLMFVRQWPGQYCSKHSCPLIHNRGYHFTIHGLWPNYEDGTWPQFCDPDYTFDESKLDDLRDALEEEWPSVFNSYESFWEHEWSKHGTCALNVFRSEHRYFKTILKLHWRYDLAAALRQADIVPREGVRYRREELEDAIYDMYGVRPLVHCYGGELSEIWMCFDKDLRPFECDIGNERNQCEELTIPPLVSEAEDDSSDAATWKKLAVQRVAAEGLTVAVEGIADDANTPMDGVEEQQQGEGPGGLGTGVDLLGFVDIGATAAGGDADPAAGGNGGGSSVDSATSAQISGVAAVLASLNAAQLDAAAKLLRAELLRDSGDEALPGRAAAAAAAAAASAAAGAGGAGALLGLYWGRLGGRVGFGGADGDVGLLDDVYDGNAADDSVFSVLEAKRHDDVAMGFLSEKKGEAEEEEEDAGADGEKATAAAGTVVGGGPDTGGAPGGSASGDQAAADASGSGSSSSGGGNVYVDWLPHDALPYGTAQLRDALKGGQEQGAAQDGDGLGWQPALTGAVNTILQELLAGLGWTGEGTDAAAAAAVRESMQTSSDVSQVVQLASAAGGQRHEQEQERGQVQLQGQQDPATGSSPVVAQTAATLLQQLIAYLAGDSAAREASAAEEGQLPYDGQLHVQDPSSSGQATQGSWGGEGAQRPQENGRQQAMQGQGTQQQQQQQQEEPEEERDAALRAAQRNWLQGAADLLQQLRVVLTGRGGLPAAAIADVGAAADPVPDGAGGAGVSIGGSRGFVWSSRLRQSEDAFTAAEDEADGLLLNAGALFGGGAAAAAVTVVSEGAGVGGGGAAAAAGGADGLTMWIVPGVVVMQQQPGASGLGASRSLLPAWVIALVIAQLVCVGVIALSLAVMAGMAIAGVWHGSREAEQVEELPLTLQAPPPVAQRLRWWRGRWTAPSASAAGLAEPLLYDKADANDDGDGDDGNGARGGAGRRGDLVSVGRYGEPYRSVLVPYPHAHDVQRATTADGGGRQDGCDLWLATRSGVVDVSLQAWEPEQQELQQRQELQQQQQQQMLQPTAAGAVRQQVSYYAPVV